MLNLVAVHGITDLRVLPARQAIVSWTTDALIDTLEVTVHTRRPQLATTALRRFEEGRRSSLDGFDDVAAIETDVVRAPADIVAPGALAPRPLAYVTASTPPADPPRERPARRCGATN